MSLYYPDRKVWLAKRETWRNRHKYEQLIWNSRSSGTYILKKHGLIGRDLHDMMQNEERAK